MMKRLVDRIVPVIASGIIRFLDRTMRIRWIGAERLEELEEGGGRFILAFWHGQILMMIRAGFSLPMTAMISRHRDGQLIADTMERFGAQAARGSTSKGGPAALRDMMRAASGSSNLAITPDGPRGPRHVAQAGAIILARATGLPILPATFSSKKKSSFAHGIGSSCLCPSAGACSSSVSRSECRARSMRRPSKRSEAGWRTA